MGVTKQKADGIDKAKNAKLPLLRNAGKTTGPSDLSSRKEFSRN